MLLLEVSFEHQCELLIFSTKLVNRFWFISQVLGTYFSINLQLHTILDEIIFGGQVLETSSTEVIKAVEEISK